MTRWRQRNIAGELPDVLAKHKAMLATHPEAVASGRFRGNRRNSSAIDRDVSRDSPPIANRSLTIIVEGKADTPYGVVAAQGGREHGYAVHFVNGQPAFDVRVNGQVTRLLSDQMTKGRFHLTATLSAEEMTLALSRQSIAKCKSPGLIPVQPKDDFSVALDSETAAGDYLAPNNFNGTITSTRVIPSGSFEGPVVAAPMKRKVLEAGLESHNRALFVKSGWIRDPFINRGPDGAYYLTGTTPLPDEPRYQNEPYNTGLGDESIVGWKMQAWRSKNLIDWESLGTPFDLTDGIWASEKPEAFKAVDQRQWRLWAPELHWLGDRWALVHTSPSPVSGANLSLTNGSGVDGPWSNPMGAAIRKRHDPSLFRDDDGTWWMIWGATQIAPLASDFSRFTDSPTKIGPSGESSKMGHEGCLMHRIGNKYVLFGTGWSTGQMRRGSYNLYYATADNIKGPYSERKFAGRFLGHGTPFQDDEGRWWCTAFYNANMPPLSTDGIQGRDLSNTAYTINQQGVTIVPLDVSVSGDGEVDIRAKGPHYSLPGPDEAQQFAR